MAWRSRYFEHHAYKRLCKEYFRAGARWISAPRPELSEDSYVPGFVAPEEGETQRYILTDHEPLFDAADAIKCGRDLFVGRSSCCNSFGIDWLRRELPGFLTRDMDKELFADLIKPPASGGTAS